MGAATRLRLGIFALVAMLALLSPVQSSANTSLLQASPSSTAPGATVTFTFSIDPSFAMMFTLHGGSTLPIAFGDGATGTITLTMGSSLTGSISHAYSAAGTYVASVALPPAATDNVPDASARVAVIATPSAKPTPKPAPTTRPTSAPRRTPVQPTVVLTWPDGSTFFHAGVGESIPHAIARVTSARAGAVIGEWYVDGRATKSETKNAFTSGQKLEFSYRADVPLDGFEHAISFRVFPSMIAIANILPISSPHINYDSKQAATPVQPIVSSLQYLQFDGFKVGKLTYTKTSHGISGVGRAHIADLDVSVQYTDVKTGSIVRGTATVLSGVGRLKSSKTLSTVELSCSKGNLRSTSGAFYDFAGQAGRFTRFGYAFSLMSLTLEPVSGKSSGALCYAPNNIESVDQVGSFNYDASVDMQGSDYSSLQFTLGLAPPRLNEQGEFAFNLPASKVGRYRMGYTPFASDPSMTSDPMHFGFQNADSSPHVTCPNTYGHGAILQQVYSPTVDVKATDCAWMPDGLAATVEVRPNTAITTSEPWQFEVIIASSSLKIAASNFLGGSMSGKFAADATAPVPVESETVAGSPSGNGWSDAKKLADNYNQQQGQSSAGIFAVNALIPTTTTASSDPAGSFSGNFTAGGDLIATTSGVGSYKSSTYTITPSSGSLFVSGGQVAHKSSDELKNYVEGLNASPLFDPSNVPNLDYSAASVQFHIAQYFSQGAASASNSTQQYNSGGSAGAPQFAFPGYYVAQGQVAAPFASGAAQHFDASAPGSGWGFAFTDGGGTSSAFSVSANVFTTLKGFPVDIQIMNVLLYDGTQIAGSLWGVLTIPAPINSQVPVSVAGTDDQGALSTGIIPAGVTIALHGWNAILALPGATAVNDEGINVDGSALSLPGWTGSPTVDGIISPKGAFDFGALGIDPALPSQRVAGLDYTPSTFFLGNDSSENAKPAQVVGTGTIAGWTSNQAVTLTFDGNNFVPAHNYSFDIAQSAGSAAFAANISYASNGAWEGQGTVAEDGLISAVFNFHADNSTETGTFSGSSSNSMIGMGAITGAARFNRDDGTMQAFGISANMNIATFAGQGILIYHTSLSDPLIAQIGGSGSLASRGWDCSQSWCVGASVQLAMDSSNKISGQLDGLFNSGGFAAYLDGELDDSIVKLQFLSQLDIGANGEFGMGVGISPIPILIVQLSGKVCVWNHSKGFAQNCLDTGHSETGVGFFVQAGGHVGLGDLADADIVAQVWYDGSGFGGHLHGDGSIQILGVGPSASADLGAQENPLGFQGSAVLSFCACLGSIDAHAAASWYDGGNFSIDSAGIGLGGPCGACKIFDPSSWF